MFCLLCQQTVIRKCIVLCVYDNYVNNSIRIIYICILYTYESSRESRSMLKMFAFRTQIEHIRTTYYISVINPLSEMRQYSSDGYEYLNGLNVRRQYKRALIKKKLIHTHARVGIFVCELKKTPKTCTYVNSSCKLQTEGTNVYPCNK